MIMTNLIAAEFLKLRTTRTVWGLLAASVAVSALAVASAVAVGADSDLDLETASGMRSVLGLSATGAIFVLVLGVIISAGEYRQRTAIDTFLTTPRRWRVIAAKLGTAGMTGVIFGACAVAVSVAVAAAVYRLDGLTFELDSADVWATLAGAVLYAALFAAIGAATGSLVRNQVAAIVGWLVWLAVVEHIAVGFAPDIGRWLPAAAGQALVRTPSDDLLSPVTAAVVLAGYATAAVAAAIVTERYRDA
jgi:ABC-2 type transport system permease protein